MYLHIQKATYIYEITLLFLYYIDCYTYIYNVLDVNVDGVVVDTEPTVVDLGKLPP